MLRSAIAKKCAPLLTCSTLFLSYLVLPVKSAGQSEEASKHHRIVGAWTIKFVSPTNPPQFQPIPGVMTFTSDGTVVESDGGEVAPTVIPGLPNQYGTTAQGVWKSEDSEIIVKFVQIFVFPDNTLSAKGTLKFKLKLDGDGDAFKGPGTFKFVDPNGNVLASGTEDLEGKRISIE